MLVPQAVIEREQARAEDQQGDAHRDARADQHRARGGVFGIPNVRVRFEGDGVCQRFESRIDAFCDPNAADDEKNGDPLEPVNLKKDPKRERCDRRERMNPGVVFAAEGDSESAKRMAETRDAIGDRERLTAHRSELIAATSGEPGCPEQIGSWVAPRMPVKTRAAKVQTRT